MRLWFQVVILDNEIDREKERIIVGVNDSRIKGRSQCDIDRIVCAVARKKHPTLDDEYPNCRWYVEHSLSLPTHA